MQVSESTRQDKEKPFGDLQVWNVWFQWLISNVINTKNLFEDEIYERLILCLGFIE